MKRELRVIKCRRKEKKFLVVKVDSDHKDSYAEYNKINGRAYLFMRAIAEFAKTSGSNFEHLVEVITYHEKCHHLHNVNGVVFSKCKKSSDGTNPKEELACDEYSIREFFKVHGFKPDINMKEYMTEVPTQGR